MSDTLLVTGATGTVGSALVEELEDSDAVVRGATRSPPGAGPAEEWVAFDFDRPETWGPAFDAATRVGARLDLSPALVFHAEPSRSPRRRAPAGRDSRPGRRRDDELRRRSRRGRRRCWSSSARNDAVAAHSGSRW